MRLYNNLNSSAFENTALLFFFKQFNSNSFKVSSPRAELGKTENIKYSI